MIQPHLPSLTVIDNANVAEPPLFDAVTVYVPVAVATVGVPDSWPVDASIASPAGKAGDTL